MIKLTPKLMFILLAGSLGLTACSNSGSNGGSSGSNGGNGDASVLQVIPPKVIYSKSGSIGDSYVVINNPSNSAIKSLHYSLADAIGGGKGVSIDPLSAANCATVAANSQCNIRVLVESGAIAGSFAFNISNDSSLLTKLVKSAKAATSAPVIGIGQSAYTTGSGADGITLSYYQTVIKGTPYILVNALVASANAGSFNQVVLVNNSGVVIPGQEIIGTVNSAQGSTFSILLPVPSGNNASQTIKVQTQQNGTVVSTATASSTLTTTSGVGIAEMLPSAVYLTTSNPEQIITFSNTGDTVAQLQQLVSNNPNVEVVFNPTSLTSGATSTATLKLKNPTVAATSGNVTLSYNNGQSETVTSGTVDQNVNPTPTPTPTPTPSPSPTPVAGLTAAFSPNNDFFTTTAVGTVSRELTLTNTGNTLESNIVLTLPSNFTISNIGGGRTNGCTVTQGTSPATISNSLSAAGWCVLTVTYTNNAVTAQASDNISIAYNYNNGIPAPTPTTAGVDYKVTQSTANLSISPSSYDFGSILANSSDASSNVLFTISNSGDIATAGSNFGFYFSGLNNSLFSKNNTGIAVGEQCGGAPLAAGASCKINVQFGPTAEVVNPATADINAIYVPYSGQSPITATSSLTGVSVGAASINISGPSASGFTGSGTSGTPYLVDTNANATLTYTFTNTGTEDATNFYVENSSLPTGWTRSGGTCASVTGTNLPNTGGSNSCTVEYTINSGTAATNNFNQNVMTENWTDGANPRGISQPVASNVTYVTVEVPSTAVTISPVANWQTIMGSSYVFSASITGGSSTVTPTVTGLSGPAVVTPPSCSLNSAVSGAESCVFIINPYTGSGNYSFWDPVNKPNSMDVNNASNAYTYTNISLTVNATGTGTTINGNASPQTFSNITGTVIAPYVYLPQTGQTITVPLNVTSITGADGNVHAGIPWAVAPNGGSTAPNPRFTDNGCDITDNLTGLIWVKDLSTVNSGESLNWNTSLSTAAAGTWCSQTAGTWRVPNINELASLINYGVGNQTTNWLNAAIASGGAGFSNVQANYYWSSSSSATYASNALILDMSLGFISSNNKGIKYWLIPVRGNSYAPNLALVPQTGQTSTLPISAPANSDGALQKGKAWPTTRFVADASGNCITDNLTGLMWVKDLNAVNSGSTLTWNAALTAADSGTWCGYSDWRMPNINELRSLVNYAYASSADWLKYGSGSSGSPACSGACFANVQQNAYWTSTIYAITTTQVLNINFTTGGISSRSNMGTLLLFPVRGGQ